MRPSTCRRPTPGPCARPCRTPCSWLIASMSWHWPTTCSLRSANESSAKPRAGAAARPTRPGRPVRLLTGHERLRPESFAKMWNSLIDTGDAGVQILQAYVVKEELRALLNLSGTNPERHLIRTRLDS